MISLWKSNVIRSMIKFICCLLLTIFSHTVVVGQKVDTAMARLYLDRALAEKASSPDSVIKYLMLSADLFEKQARTSQQMPIWDRYLFIHHQLLPYADDMKFSDFQELNSKLKENTKFFDTEEKASKLREAELNYLFGSSMFLYYKNRNQAKLESAILPLKDSYQLFSDVAPSSPLLADIQCKLGEAYYVLEDFDLSEKHFKQSMSDQDKSELKNLSLAAIQHNFLANINYQRGDYESAKKFRLKHIEIIEHNPETSSETMSNAYYGLGAIYFQLRDLENAQLIFEQELNVQLNAPVRNESKLSRSYLNVGTILHVKKDREKAISFYEKAIDVQLKQVTPDTALMIKIYNNIGIIYLDLDDPQKGLFYNKKALTLSMASLGESHHELAPRYLNIGAVYRELNMFPEAKASLEKAIEIYRKKFGPNHPNIAKINNSLGILYRNKENYEEAIRHHQIAIKTVVPSFSYHSDIELPSNEERVINYHRLITSLHYKGIAFHQWGTASQEVKKLTLADSTFSKAIYWIKKLEQQQSQVDNKLWLKSIFGQTFRISIQNLILLRKLDPDNRDIYAEKALKLSELNKASLIRYAVNESNFATSESALSEAIKAKTETIAKINETEKALHDLAVSPSEGPNISDLQQQLLSLNQTLDSILDDIRSKHPEFFDLMYSSQEINVKETQAKLKSDAVLIEYFLLKDEIVSFLLTNHTFELRTVHCDSIQLIQLVNHVIRGISCPFVNEASCDSIKHISNELYQSAASKLYPYLIPPNLDSSVKKLLIIPDGILGYLPFETLLSDSTNLRSYLVNDHQISYYHSLSNYMNPRSDVKSKKGYLAFAPDFQEGFHTNEMLALEETTPSTSGLRNRAFGPLEHNMDEVQNIQQFMGGDIFIAEKATLNNFLKYASQYQILHIASHAFVDDDDIEFSGIVFNQHGEEHNLLYLSDLFTLSFQPELVVLSACETGKGKLYPGEGIMSLASGFSYAGAKSILTTLWSVNDKVSAVFMERFYYYIHAGYEKHTALFHTKNEFIESGELPFYWAGFILIGNTDPIQLSSHNSGSRKTIIFYILLSMLVIMGLGYGVFRRKMTNT